MTDPQNASLTGSRTPEEVLDDMLAVQCADGNWNYDPYMHGLANGLLMAKSIFTKEEPDFLEAPETWKKDVELKAEKLRVAYNPYISRSRRRSAG